MAKRVRFIKLTLENFTSHRNRIVEYGNITRLSGQNGEGKTSIGIAPVWILYGTDLQGSRFNPSPINYDFDHVYASLLLSLDDKELLFTREINKKGTNQFYINDVPAKAKEYDAAVANLFDKDEFLSLYYPPYFFTQHWTKQREQIMKYTSVPVKSNVLTEMSRTSPSQKAKDIPFNPHAAKLAELTKKHSLDDLKKIHGGPGGKKSKLEKAHIAAQSRTKTLQEQLDRIPESSVDIEAAKSEEAKLLEQIKAIEKVTDSAGDNNRKIIELDSHIKTLLEQRDAKKAQFPALQNEKIADTCRVCKQPLQGDSIEAAEADKQKRIEQFKSEYDAIVAERKELESKRAALEYIDVSEQLQKVRELDEKREPLLAAIRNHDERERLQQEVDQAKADEAATLTSLKESIFILDAIKAYRAKEAELQAEKVQSLFTTLSIRLFKYVKASGEYEPDFSVQMQDKDYAVLSAGEKISVGLELTEVLFKQSELIVPTFIDGIESYTGKVDVYDQLITGKAAPNQQLQIETGEAE